MMNKLSEYVVLLLIAFVMNTSLLAQAPPPPPKPSSSQVDAENPLSATIITKNNKKGLKNPYNQTIVAAPIYDNIKEVHASQTSNVYSPAQYWEKLYRVKKNQKYGVLNAKGETLIPIIYDQITENYLVKNGKYGLVNLKNETILPFKYEKLFPVYRDLLSYKEQGRWGILEMRNNSPSIILSAKYKAIDRLILEDFAFLIDDQNLKGVYDLKQKKIAIKPQYKFLEWSIIQPKLKYAMDDYKVYYFKIKKDNKVGLIDLYGKIIVPAEQDEVTVFGNSKEPLIITIKKDGKFRLLSPNGKQFSSGKYDKIKYLNRERFAVQLNGKFGVLNPKGGFIAPIIYDKIGKFQKYQDASFVVIGDKYGVLDSSGKILLPVSTKLPEGGGYEDLNDLYQAFVTALKSNDEKIMYNFCKDISPDSLTLSYMIMNEFEYRGIPFKLAEKGITVDSLSKTYFQFLKDYQTKLSNLGNLAELSLIGPEHEGVSVHDEANEIFATETFIKLQFGNSERRAKLGELLQIDGIWKVFSYPKFR